MVDYKRRLKFITLPDINKCIFCDSNGPLTREHVFSKWTHKFIPNTRTAKYESVRAIRGPLGDEVHIFKMPGDIRDWKIQCVCSPVCNNGWMRDKIENPARPVLLELIRGNKIRLMPDDQLKIARWAALKAMVAEYNTRGHVTTHHKQRKRMMRSQLPPQFGWGIWIGHFQTDPGLPDSQRYGTNWASSPILIPSDKLKGWSDNKPATYFNSHSSTQLIGNLFIQIIRSPMRTLIPRWKFVPPDRGTLLRIWPRSGVSISWPPKAMSDLDCFYTRDAFQNFVLAIQRRMHTAPL